MKRIFSQRIITMIPAILLIAERADACSVCFTNPDSELTAGAKMGVLFLLGVVCFVLSAIACVAISWSRRARRLQVPNP